MGEAKYIENGKLKPEYVGMKFGIIKICNDSFRRIPYGNHGSAYGIVRAECEQCGFKFDVDLYHLLRKGDRKHCPNCKPRRFCTTEEYPEVIYSDSYLDQCFTKRMSDKQIVERYYKECNTRFIKTVRTECGPYYQEDGKWKKHKNEQYAEPEFRPHPATEFLEMEDDEILSRLRQKDIHGDWRKRLRAW